MPKIQRSDGAPGQTAPLPPLPPPEQKIPPPAPPARLYDQDKDEALFAAPPGMGRPQKRRRKRKKGDFLYTLAILVCAAVFLVSGGMLIKRCLDDQKTESEFSSLAALVDNTAAPSTENSAGELPSNAAKFAALQQKNPDFFGWLSIEGTNLDYPVMFAPDNKDFYLRHDFEGAYSVYGVPYLDEETEVGNAIESQNLIVYGHNMKTGTIFGCLTGYKNADYYAAHPQITFDNLYGDARYEVFAAFSIDVVSDPDFVYNRYINMDETEYKAYVNEVLARSDVKTALHPAYGEQLLTLSTCEYSTDNGRYVVVARRVEGEYTVAAKTVG